MISICLEIKLSEGQLQQIGKGVQLFFGDAQQGETFCLVPFFISLGPHDIFSVKFCFKSAIFWRILAYETGSSGYLSPGFTVYKYIKTIRSYA